MPPNFGTAVAISDHFLLTAAHCLYWEHDIRPSASDDEASCWFALYPDDANNSIRICHQLDDDVDRLDMFYEPSPDDPIIAVFQYADGHDSSKIYFVDDPTFGADTVLDLALLYSLLLSGTRVIQSPADQSLSTGHILHPLSPCSRIMPKQALTFIKIIQIQTDVFLTQH